MIQSRWDWETVFGATAETATGTGALPSKVPVGGRAQAPANGSLEWTNGAKDVARNIPKGFHHSARR